MDYDSPLDVARQLKQREQVAHRAVIRHLTLRYLLVREDHMPWRYAGFLDHATECIFLRKVGGGYIFIHRLLLEYFASIESDATP